MLCLSLSKVLLRNPVDCQNYTEILLHLWFSAGGNCAIQGTFGGTEDILMVTLGEEGRMPLAPGRWRTERLLNTLQCYSAQHSPPNRELSSPTVSSGAVEKPCSGAKNGGQENLNSKSQFPT